MNCMTNSNPAETSNKKMVAGLTGIFLGSLGIHKFVAQPKVVEAIRGSQDEGTERIEKSLEAILSAEQ